MHDTGEGYLVKTNPRGYSILRAAFFMQGFKTMRRVAADTAEWCLGRLYDPRCNALKYLVPLPLAM